MENIKKVYNKDIRPLIIDIKKKCYLNKIPMVFVAKINDEEYDKEFLLSAVDKNPVDKRIKNCLATMSGYKTTPPKAITEALMIIERYLDELETNVYEDIPEDEMLQKMARIGLVEDECFFEEIDT